MGAHGVNGVDGVDGVNNDGNYPSSPFAIPLNMPLFAKLDAFFFEIPVEVLNYSS